MMTSLDALRAGSLSHEDLLYFLTTTSSSDRQALFEAAYATKLQYVGNKVFFRGIIEFSNQCIKNCNYCGIRRENSAVSRFCMSPDEIVECAKWAVDNKYGSIVLQSGERCDSSYVSLVEEVVHRIKEMSGGKLGVTLSLGEQSLETYHRWYKAGAHRYLLRIESSNPLLYARLHPEDHIYEERVDCLKALRAIGYQVGTGVMIGLPFQTPEDLVNDILFFRKMDVDMIGMGPYVVSADTPLAEQAANAPSDRAARFELALRMIALCRLYLKDINIAATTALQALNPLGREEGLKAGANIIMPIITSLEHRKDYQLYDGKPCLDESPDQCKSCLERRIQSVGDEVAKEEWGDSPHFRKRQGEAKS